MGRSRLTPEKKAAIANFIDMYDIKTTGDIQDALKDLLGETIQSMLEAELDEELGYEKYEKTEETKTNYRNGYKPKTLKSTMGELEIEMPQDRNSKFEPKIVRQHKTNISEIEQKIINMYARGQSTREIKEQIYDIYGFETSAEMISKITDKIAPQIEEWQKVISACIAVVFVLDLKIFRICIKYHFGYDA